MQSLVTTRYRPRPASARSAGSEMPATGGAASFTGCARSSGEVMKNGGIA